jgi:hypothetical protein
MRAREFIPEGLSITPSGKMSKNHERAQIGTHLSRDIGGYDRVYHMNRLMMAMAVADGKSTKAPEGVDASSWSEKYNTIHPYSEEEHNMVAQAMKIVPTDGQEIAKDHRSRESDDVHKVSPVKGFKGYPR